MENTHTLKDKIENCKSLFELQDILVKNPLPIFYKISENEFTVNPSAKIFNSDNSCTNSYFKISDNCYAKNPF